MKKTIIICDKCKAEASCKTIYIKKDKPRKCAEDDNYELHEIDLCINCMSGCLNTIISDKDIDKLEANLMSLALRLELV